MIQRFSNNYSASSLSTRALWLGISSFLIGLLWLLLPTGPADACGPVASFQGYSFLNREIVDTSLAAYGFFTGFESMFGLLQEEEHRTEVDNIEEWRIKVCEDALDSDIRYVLFKSDPADLQQLRTSIQSKNMPMPLRLRDNSFANYLQRNGCLETVNYLLYAKACEPHVTAPENDWEEPKRNQAAMQALIDQGIAAFEATASHYIKMRYAYQLIRLAHYKKDYEQALKLYDYLVPKFDVEEFEGKPSIIYYWILGHQAGCLKALGRYVEASYIYADIFAHCPSRRQSSFQSFYLKTDEDWKACLLLCKTDQERAMLYGIRANARDSRALEEMEEMYRLYPQDPELELLLVKEIRELEKDLLGIEFNNMRNWNQRLFNRPRPFAGDYVIELQKFVRQLHLEGQVRRPKLWHLAEGYLQLIAGDYYKAGQTLLEVNEKTTNPELKEQIAILLLAQQIALLEGVNDTIEQTIYDIRLHNSLYRKYRDLPDFLRDKSAHLYEEYGEKGKAFILQHSLQDLKLNPNHPLIDDLLAISTKADRNPLEILLTTDAQGRDITNALWDLKATLYMQQNNYEAALEMYKEIPRAEWDRFAISDPFRPTIRDCFSCPHSKDTSDLFNKGEFFQEILDLQYKARAEPDKSATYYLKIGVALYNTSYFGHSWHMLDYFRSGSTWDRMRRDEDQVFTKDGAALGNKELLDLSQPLYFFERARLTTVDPELAAKATFMAAKCELAQFYQSELYQAPPCCNRIPEIPDTYTTQYQRLKETYGDTQFYQELLEECQFFRVYALK